MIVISEFDPVEYKRKKKNEEDTKRMFEGLDVLYRHNQALNTDLKIIMKKIRSREIENLFDVFDKLYVKEL